MYKWIVAKTQFDRTKQFFCKSSKSLREQLAIVSLREEIFESFLNQKCKKFLEYFLWIKIKNLMITTWKIASYQFVDNINKITSSSLWSSNQFPTSTFELKVRPNAFVIIYIN